MRKKDKAEITEDTINQIFDDRKRYLKSLRKLYSRVKKKINKVSKYVGKRKKKRANRKTMRKLDQLKYHRNQVKDMFYAATLANEKEWKALKNNAKNVYHAAADVI